MTPDKVQFLKDVLSVPTKTYREGLMVEYISTWLKQKEIPFYVDEHLNVYATKQNDPTIEHFPCVVAHTDTVHNLDSINVKEEMLPNASGELKQSLMIKLVYSHVCCCWMNSRTSKPRSLSVKKQDVTDQVKQILSSSKMLGMLLSLMPLRTGW